MMEARRWIFAMRDCAKSSATRIHVTGCIKPLHKRWCPSISASKSI